ncbi:MAG: calcineurin-like phosphoesterase family protein [bacterium]|nr:calcineurin-like phosphoesterase family protein [bacterium]
MTRYRMSFILLLIVLGLFDESHPQGAAAAGEATGIVFADANRNGRRDPDERGLAGIAVSNQQEVVRTGADGRYRLSVGEETVLFVTKPAGYAAPLDANHLPRFYYIHQPAGSPAGMKYAGVAPTGPLPPSVDFPLVPVAEPDVFEAAVLGDPQLSNPKEAGYFAEDIVSELAGSPTGFVLTLGDLANNDLSIYPAYEAVLAQAGKPVYNCSGNHDENYDFADDTHALETYKARFGPPYYSFDCGKVHFMVFDSVWWSKPKGEEGGYIGKLGERQLAWMKNDLALAPPDRLIVLASHIPFMNPYAHGPGSVIAEREAAFALLRDRPRVLALAGHYHSFEQYYGGAETGWLGAGSFRQLVCGATCGCWWEGPLDARGIPIATMDDGSPNGYLVVRFEGNSYTTRYKAAGFDPAFRMRISAPAMAFHDDAPSTRVVVNVFDASPRTRVECAVDGGSWQPMRREFIPDPYMVRLYESNRAAPGWDKKEAGISSHIWTAPLPALASGVHRVKVRAAEPGGRPCETTRVFTSHPTPGSGAD